MDLGAREVQVCPLGLLHRLDLWDPYHRRGLLDQLVRQLQVVLLDLVGQQGQVHRGDLVVQEVLYNQPIQLVPLAQAHQLVQLRPPALDFPRVLQAQLVPQALLAQQVQAQEATQAAERLRRGWVGAGQRLLRR